MATASIPTAEPRPGPRPPAPPRPAAGRRRRRVPRPAWRRPHRPTSGRPARPADSRDRAGGPTASRPRPRPPCRATRFRPARAPASRPAPRAAGRERRPRPQPSRPPWSGRRRGAACWASRMREASPSRVKPTTAGAYATIGQASAAVRPDPGPRTNTRATGTAVATRRPAPSQLATTIERTRLGEHPTHPGAAVRGGRRQPREDQLEQRGGQHRVRQQVDRGGPGEPGQRALVPGLLVSPADHQHAGLLQHQADQPGSGDPAYHRPVAGGEPETQAQPQTEPQQRHHGGQRQGEDPGGRAPAQRTQRGPVQRCGVGPRVRPGQPAKMR